MSDQELWLAVIAQAFADATSVLRTRAATSKKSRAHKQATMNEHLKLRTEAREWLINSGRDFYYVCALAGVESAAVRRRALALRDGDWRVESPIFIADTVAERSVNTYV